MADLAVVQVFSNEVSILLNNTPQQTGARSRTRGEFLECLSRDEISDDLNLRLATIAQICLPVEGGLACGTIESPAYYSLLEEKRS